MLTVILILVRGERSQRFLKKTGGERNQRKNRDHLDTHIAKISQKTQKTSEKLAGLAFIQTSAKN